MMQPRSSLFCKTLSFPPWCIFFGIVFLVTTGNAYSGIRVEITTDGSGDYNCDGTDDQEQINTALDFVATHADYTTVFLKGPNTYVITEPIVISSNTILTGDSTAKVQLKDNTDWPMNKPLIRQKGAEHWLGDLSEAIYGTDDDSIVNSEISGFELTAGTQNASPGSWAYILMIFYGASDLSIHDMNLHDSYGDIIRVMSTGITHLNSRLHFYNNTMAHSGHEGFYLGYAQDVEINNNTIYSTRTNDGIRLDESRRVVVHGNTIGNSLNNVPSGYAGIYIGNDELPLETAQIYNNYIFGKAGGIVLEAEGAADAMQMQNGVHIHHNKIYKIFDNTAGGDNFLNGGIHIYGAQNTLIELNTIEGSYKDGIIYEMGGHSGSGYQTIVRNNSITNSTGYGINNQGGNEHTFVCEYNNLFNNSLGDYFNASSTTDIHFDPLYAESSTTDHDAVDLHLKSAYGRWNGTSWVQDDVTSPCIDAGSPDADYSHEPQGNGVRVNIGVYGNTEYASKSALSDQHSSFPFFFLIRGLSARDR